MACLSLSRNAVYCSKPALLLQAGADPGEPWHRHEIQTGYVEEGLAADDIDGDGHVEIVQRRGWYHIPAGRNDRRPLGAPYIRSGPPRDVPCGADGHHRSGSLDILIVDSEYMDGRLSWFENKLASGGARRACDGGWAHLSHSLQTYKRDDGKVMFYCGEMGQGRLERSEHFITRVIEYVTVEGGKRLERTVISQGEGTHEARLIDVDGDGDLELVGKDAYENILATTIIAGPIWKKAKSISPLSTSATGSWTVQAGAGIDLISADIDGDGSPELSAQMWYRVDTGRAPARAGNSSVIAAYDIDGDGKLELIGIKPTPGPGLLEQAQLHPGVAQADRP